MLISFSISNFRSFREEQTLSMVASRRLAAYHPEHCAALPGSDQQLLPLAAIYGANGSGKSNWVKAVNFAKELVINGTKPETRINRQPFLLSPEQASQPTSVEFRFLADNLAFSYGFTTSDTEICTEWLSLIEGEHERTIYERQSAEAGVQLQLGTVLTNPDFGDYTKIKALAEVGVRRNQLFLTAIRQNVDRANRGLLFEKVIDFFENQLGIIFPQTSARGLADFVTRKPEFAEFASTFLNGASTGIERLRVDTTEAKEEGLGLPSGLLRLISEDSSSATDSVHIVNMGDRELTFYKDKNGKLFLKTIQAEHAGDGNQHVLLPLREESDGTVRLTHLLPALFLLKTESNVGIIDEIDRSLHPALSKKFVEFFLKSCRRTGSQLIFTTHESNLLDLDLLRRDEIWFMEKNPEGATELYSLSDFRVRQDLRIQKGYLQGRFGAIPFLGNLDRLLEETKAS